MSQSTLQAVFLIAIEFIIPILIVIMIEHANVSNLFLRILGCGPHCRSCNIKNGCDAAPQLETGGAYTNWYLEPTLRKHPNFKQSKIYFPVPGYFAHDGCKSYSIDKFNCLVCNDNYYNYRDDGAPWICQTTCVPYTNYDAIYGKYTFDIANCSLTSNGQLNSISACHDGYIHSSNPKTCTYTCGIGYAPYIVYTYRGTARQTSCQRCDSSCLECSNIGYQNCKSCFKGQYLNLPDRNLQVGVCTAKSSQSLTAEIYVGPAGLLNNRDSSSITGSSTNYFNSIQDAIKKAYELGAEYSSAEITIKLIDGSHTMVRYYPEDKYMPTKLDQYSKTTKIILQPASPNIQLTINYKLRDTFHFLVGGGLTMRNLIFEGIDSTLDFLLDYYTNLKCAQNQFQQCCFIDSNGNLAGQPSCRFQTKPQIFQIKSIIRTEKCYAADGTNFILFDMYSQNMLTTPPTLELEINKNQGGYIKMKNVVFDNFNTCGAIVRNKLIHRPPTGIDYSNYKTFYQSTLNNDYTTKMREKLDLSNQNPYSASCSNTQAQNSKPCFSLSVEGSTFKNFGSMKESMSYGNQVDPDYLLQYQGLIFDLDGFNGNIKLVGNTFENNVIKYDSCKVGEYFKNKQGIFDFEQDMYPSYGTKTALQIKSWISIVNHGDWEIDIVDNKFLRNTAVMGLIVLSLNQKYLSTSNYFEKNYACSQTGGGIIRMYCVNQNTSISDINLDTPYEDMAQDVAQKYYQNIKLITLPLKIIQKTYQNYVYNVPYQINQFQSNTYKQNFASNNISLISIQALRTIFNNETFIGNGESSIETTQWLGENGRYIQASPSSELTAFQLSQLDSQTQVSSLIELFRHHQVHLTQSSFDSNWQYESQASQTKGQLLTLAFFQGYLYFDQLTVLNHIGIQDNPLGPEYLGFNIAQNYPQRVGAISPFIKLQWHTRILPIFYFKFNYQNFYFMNIKWQHHPDLQSYQMLFNYRDPKIQLQYDQYITQTQDFQLMHSIFEDVDCYNCNNPILTISSATMLIRNITFTNVNFRAQQSQMQSKKVQLEVSQLKQ
ncbi:UNKNOWN [Stylonychia lemnae]|uniref:Uncharacterized protein n=1 Tax=Stylonychia lemnae TaxID=5949 RepID=A0A078B596_STYLE|nr:UNKNOWN [Stylonychia lemnae]|eukprot:CDW89700.1 UNKNOWN [Stylonychia lemnae]